MNNLNDCNAFRNDVIMKCEFDGTEIFKTMINKKEYEEVFCITQTEQEEITKDRYLLKIS